MSNTAVKDGRKRRKTLNFWQKCEAFPPILCRILAKHSGLNGRALGAPKTTLEIASETGLSLFQVDSMSRQLDWRGIDIPTMRSFLNACGVDFEDGRQMKRVAVYMAGRNRNGIQVPPKLTYLRTHPDWEKVFKPLVNEYLKSRKQEP